MILRSWCTAGCAETTFYHGFGALSALKRIESIPSALNGQKSRAVCSICAQRISEYMPGLSLRRRTKSWSPTERKKRSATCAGMIKQLYRNKKVLSKENSQKEERKKCCKVRDNTVK